MEDGSDCGVRSERGGHQGYEREEWKFLRSEEDSALLGLRVNRPSRGREAQGNACSPRSKSQFLRNSVIAMSCATLEERTTQREVASTYTSNTSRVVGVGVT